MKHSRYIALVLGLLAMLMLSPTGAMANETTKDDFSHDTDLWSYTGDAYWDRDHDYMVLTKNEENQNSIVWLDKTVALPFKASFRYKAGAEEYPGDGFTFMFNKQKNYSPNPGGALNFDPGLGYGIEFDSYPYNHDDPDKKHIALIRDTTTNHLAYSLQDKAADNIWHDIVIQVSKTEVKAFLDGHEILKWQGTLDNTYGGIGFSAATGDRTNLQLIDDFEITSITEDEDISDDILTGDSLLELLDDAYAHKYIDNKGIYNSLRTKLVKGNILPFIKELYAQKGKHVTVAVAQDLIDEAWQEIKVIYENKFYKEQKKVKTQKELKVKSVKQNIQKQKQKYEYKNTNIHKLSKQNYKHGFKKHK